MKITPLEIGLAIMGPIVLRPVIHDNYRYLLACMFYGFMLGIGRIFIEDIYRGDE